MFDTILFVDFDGTITSEDTLDGALRQVVPQELYQEKMQAMLSGRLTLSQVVKEGFASIPSDRFPEMLDYFDRIPMRKGFEELLDAMDSMGIPVVVISGGLRQFVERRIGYIRQRFLGLHYVELDLSEENMRLISDYDDGKELLAKTTVMAQYEYRHAWCIGDSYTDINMAAASDRVFARDALAEILEKKGIAYTPWKDFFDVIKAVRN